MARLSLALFAATAFLLSAVTAADTTCTTTSTSPTAPSTFASPSSSRKASTFGSLSSSSSRKAVVSSGTVSPEDSSSTSRETSPESSSSRQSSKASTFKTAPTLRPESTKAKPTSSSTVIKRASTGVSRAITGTGTNASAPPSSTATINLGPYLNDTVGPLYNDTSGAFTPVVGCPSVASRLPLGQLQSQYPDVFNMYILALQSMMNTDESHELSYYQFAGIHGRPYIPFEHHLPDGTDFPQYGYCTHTSVLFATWHRPFLILLEQTLYAHAVKQAKKFTGADQARYMAAADKVRLPYWDWSSSDTQSRIPPVMMQQKISVTTPTASGSSTTKSIDNPLFSYKFQSSSFRAEYFANTWQEQALETLRRPTSLTQSNNTEASDIMFNTYAARRQNTLNLFTIDSFGAFSSDTYRPDQTPVDWTSVESIHNEIHSIIGGDNGHMTWIDFSSFDPIFWLHHTNVDRLAAMYQAVKPNNVVAPWPRQGPTFVYPDGQGTEDINTPLHPFRHPSAPANDLEWTSNDVSSAKSIFQYGYEYPEVPAKYQNRSDADLQSYTSQQVQTLYGAQAAVAAVKAANNGKTKRQSAAANATSVGFTGNSTSLTRREWIAHIIFDPGDLDGTFTTWITLGSVPQNVADLLTYDGLVGGATSFGAKGKKMDRHNITSCVPLTKALLDKHVNLDVVSAVKYLKRSLSWVVAMGTEEVPVAQLPSLKVGVSTAEVTYSTDTSKLPVYGVWETHYEITQGKQGGLKPAAADILKSDTAVPVANGTSSSNSTRF